MVDQNKFTQALFEGSIESVKRLAEDALHRGESPEAILNDGLIKAMDQVGMKFRSGEIYLPEVLIASRAMHAGLGILKPLLARTGPKTAAKVVLGTVKGDVHDIGKNLVGMMLEGGGFEVVDIGVDAPPEKFIQAINDSGAKIVGMSALLTSTMIQMKATIEALKTSPLSRGLKIIVGGAPVTDRFAREIGASGYAPDAVTAVEKVRAFLDVKSVS